MSKATSGGPAAALALFASGDIVRWQHWEAAYDTALSGIGSRRPGKRSLEELDSWLRKEWPQQAKKSGLQIDSLEKIASWKLTRGTWRPLLPRIMSNPPGLVKSCWKAAVDSHGRGGTIAALTKLDGIGPATASAITAPVFEDLPFMSDEALLASGCPLKYDLRTYDAFAAKLQAKALSLEKGSTRNNKGKAFWTAERIGRALWACAVSVPVAVDEHQALAKQTIAPSHKRPSAAIETVAKIARR